MKKQIKFLKKIKQVSIDDDNEDTLNGIDLYAKYYWRGQASYGKDRSIDE